MNFSVTASCIGENIEHGQCRQEILANFKQFMLVTCELILVVFLKYVTLFNHYHQRRIFFLGITLPCHVFLMFHWLQSTGQVTPWERQGNSFYCIVETSR